MTYLPGCRDDTESAFSRARRAAMSPGAKTPEACCTARSSRPAAAASKSMPALASSPCRVRPLPVGEQFHDGGGGLLSTRLFRMGPAADQISGPNRLVGSARASATTRFGNTQKNAIRSDPSGASRMMLHKMLNGMMACPAKRRGPNHGYGALAFNLSRNHRLWRLDCRRHARRWLAFGLDAHGTTYPHSRIDQPLWVGSGSKNVTF
jgi:hypothetical protein